MNLSWSNQKIGVKLTFAFTLISLILLSGGLLNYLSMFNMHKQTFNIIKAAPLVESALKMKLAISSNLQLTRKVVEEDNIVDFNDHKDELEIYDEEFNLYANASLNGAETESGIIYAAKGEELRAALSDSIDFFKNEFSPRILKIYDIKLGQLLRGEVDTETQNILSNLNDEVNEYGEKMMLQLDEVETFAKEEITNANIASNKITSLSKLMSVIIIISGVFLSVSLGFLITWAIRKPLNQCVTFAKSIEKGDLTESIDIKGRDETGILADALKKMSVNLQDMVKKISSSTSSLAGSAEKTLAITFQITSDIGQQVQQLEQAAASTTEMSQTIVSVAQNASEASQSAKESVDVANEGKDVVGQTVAGIMSIAQSVESTAKVIGELGESSKQIGDIIDVIYDIADQTNLLALNAAIEAARAGEQGRGFAVVADEVRKLAERTGTATQEISGMIRKIQGDTDISVKSMEDGKKKADDGVALAEQAREALDKIVQSNKTGLDMVQMIAAATEELSSGIEEVSTTMDDINGRSKNTEEAISEVNTSTDDLVNIAGDLINLVAWFKVENAESNKTSGNEEPESQTQAAEDTVPVWAGDDGTSS